MDRDWRMESTQALMATLKNLGSHALVGDVGHAVSWRRFGAGAPLVLLHGGHGSWLHWIRNIEQLAASHEVWVLDMPGFGESDALPPDASFNALVDAISLSIAQILGHETAIDLAGFSFGSVVASALALRRGNVRKLALLGPTGHGGLRRESSPMVNWRRSTAQADLLADLKKNLEVLMLHGPVDPLALEIHRYSCLHTRYRSKQTSQSAVLPALLEPLQLPILMVWGEHDATGVPQEIGPRYQDARPERQWKIIPGAGHWVQYEAADFTNDLLLDWFNKC
jgi:pimeloyl-ACP methyl ester carboxylesterase